MTNYHVVWAAEIDAETQTEAANKAYAMLRDPSCSTLSFLVEDGGTKREILANSPPEKRFTLSFSIEGERFQKGFAARRIMDLLGTVSGNVATGRFAGVLRDGGQEIGRWHSAWRRENS